MKIATMKQYSPEWWALKVAKIGGTRFGAVISGKKNRLVYDLMAEVLLGYVDHDGYVDDNIQFGLDNEPIAATDYEAQSGIKFKEVGAILSDFNDIHLTSVDRVNVEQGIALEIKCTQNAAIHLQRFFEGPETSYLPQIKSAFAISDEVNKVHWVSYCPFVQERPLVVHIFERWEFEQDIPKWRDALARVEKDLAEKLESFKF